MRGKLLKVRDKLAKRRKDSIIEDTSRSNTDASTTNVPLSLLTLPAEIRNDIYQLLAESTTLTLTPSSPKKRPPPVGLLCACKQTWREYRAVLMSKAVLIIPVQNYNFGVVVRTFEKLNPDDLALMHLNPQLWLYLWLGHVPNRDDRRALRAWCDYRIETVGRSYFGTQRIPRDIVFQYNVKFLSSMRPPRPPSRYSNGFEMKLDLLRSHVRMANVLQPPEEEPNFELVKIREDLDDCVNVLKEILEEINDGPGAG